METVSTPPARSSVAVAPLLPRLLTAPSAFLWIWVLPIAVLLLLNFRAYGIVKGDMTEDQLGRALLLGLGGLGNALIGLILFAISRLGSGRPSTTAWTGIAAIVVQVAYLWWATNWASDVIPRTWIYPQDRFVFCQFTFAMMPLFWGVLLLASTPLSGNSGRMLLVSLGVAAGAPLLLFLLAQILGRIAQTFTLRWLGTAVFITIIVVLGVLMFVGIVGALLYAFRALRRWEMEMERIAVLVFALVLPVCGLLLNRQIPFPVSFQATEVYIITAANALVMAFASFQASRRPTLSFALLWATLPFSLYFFLTFLPYTPLSIIAIIAFGSGFLILTPTVLFVLHLLLLNRARVSPHFGGGVLRRVVIAVLSFAVLPSFFVVRGLADKTALHAALDYVYAPEVKAGDVSFHSSLANLSRALRSHRDYKDGIYYPMLSDFYSWLVFDGLVLPDDKLGRLEEIFLGGKDTTTSTDPVRQHSGFGGGSVRRRTQMGKIARMPQTVDVAAVTARVHPAGEENSVVTIALTLRNHGASPAEFVQELPLPSGVFVNGFRLSVNGALVPGRIFEKKTALWVYSMIRDIERRDPGILFYNAADQLQLKVFPVAPDREQPTTVEIDFLVPVRVASTESLTGLADAAEMLRALGRLSRPQVAREELRVALAGIPPGSLPDVKREAYLEVIVDRSAGNGFDGDLGPALNSLRKKFPAVHSARVSLANYEVADLVKPLTSLDELIAAPPANYRAKLPKAGGFYADLAIACALRRHRDLDLESNDAGVPLPAWPIFVILSRHAQTRLMESSLVDAWAEIVPTVQLEEIGSDGSAVTHRAPERAAAPLVRLGRSIRPFVPHRFVHFDSGEKTLPEFFSPSKGNWLPLEGMSLQPASTPWAQAMALQSRQADYAKALGRGAEDLSAVVKASRESGVLIPSTTFIVVERAAQWRLLELSERTKLGQNTALDFLETPAPPSMWIAAAFALWLAARRRWNAGRRTRSA
ncbi:MAG: hypothetical protein JWM32_2817 [Verrucomicrobia bacterium]|nr:hypothetical protein [Verrucomicrobiota bacterium]